MESFFNLGVSPELVASVEKLGFVNPTPIQEKAIPVLLSSTQDFIGLASTGTGKTAAFGLPLLQLINPDERRTQGLIIAPTRELCLQITNDLKEFSTEMRELVITAVYGGASIEAQIRELRRGTQIIVATPGRLIDLIDRGAARIEDIDYVVLDEADEMLNMGFKEDIDAILSAVQGEHRIWLFSATMPAEVRAIANNFMTNPFELTVGSKNATNTNITHEYYLVRAKDRYAALKRIVDFNPEIFGIVFTRTKIEAQETAERLMKDGYSADSLHGDLSQAQRDRVMARYRERAIRMLVATDVAARGIDVDDITHVINFGLPDEPEVYTHRSGRTARAGKTGFSISIIHSKEQGKIRQIEKLSRATFLKKEVPSGEDVCQKQMMSMVQKVHGVEVNDEQMENFMPAIYEELKDLSREDIIKRFVSVEFNRFLSYYENSGDINMREGERDNGRNERGRVGYERLFVSLGELDGVDKPRMLKFINSLRLGRIEVGRIEIKRSFSFIEIEKGMADEFLDQVNGQRYEGRELKAERAGDKPVRSDRGGDRRDGGDRGRGGFDRRGRNDRSDRGDRGAFRSDKRKDRVEEAQPGRRSVQESDRQPSKGFSFDFDKLFAEEDHKSGKKKAKDDNGFFSKKKSSY